MMLKQQLRLVTEQLLNNKVYTLPIILIWVRRAKIQL